VSDDLVWRLGARTPGHDYGIFRTETVEADHPRGGPRKRFSLIACADWVNVIALTAKREVVLLRQFRPGTSAIYVEIPGGMIDPGEDPAHAAARELREETGYTSERWRPLGVVAPNPAIQGNRLFTFLAEDAERTAAATPDDGEVLAIHTAPLAAVYDQLRTGAIDHALVVAAFAHLMLADDGQHLPR